MTSRYVGDLTHCEHLFVLEGTAAEVDAFLQSAHTPGVPFSLAALLPAPEGLREMDPLTWAHYHLVSGDVEKARVAYDEIGAEWPVFENAEATEALRVLLRGNPDIVRDALVVQRNLQRWGVADARQWRLQTWGSNSDIKECRIERVSAERVHVHVVDSTDRTAALQLLCCQRPGLTTGCIVANFAQRTQSWLISFKDTDRTGNMLKTKSRQFCKRSWEKDQDLVELFLDNWPEQFHAEG